jgi:hypothetical protein
LSNFSTSFNLDKKFPATVYRAVYPRTRQHSREHKITQLKEVKGTRRGYWKPVITEMLHRTFTGKDTQSWNTLTIVILTEVCTEGQAIACSSYEDCWCNAQTGRRINPMFLTSHFRNIGL